jgi:hypothetical protein
MSPRIGPTIVRIFELLDVCLTAFIRVSSRRTCQRRLYEQA